MEAMARTSMASATTQIVKDQACPGETEARARAAGHDSVSAARRCEGRGQQLEEGAVEPGVSFSEVLASLEGVNGLVPMPDCAPETVSAEESGLASEIASASSEAAWSRQTDLSHWLK